MKNAARVKKHAVTAVTYAGLILLSLFFLFPFLFMFFKSVMGDLESYGTYGVHFFPQEWHFENYLKIFDADFIRYFRNTMIVVVCNIVLIPLAASVCAYGFARGSFRGKNFWFTVVLGTVMLPGAVTQVPVYILFRMFNLTGTLAPLIIPSIFGGGPEHLSDPAVHPLPPAGDGRGSHHRRGREVHHLRPHHPAPVQAHPHLHGDQHLHDQLAGF